MWPISLRDGRDDLTIKIQSHSLCGTAALFVSTQQSGNSSLTSDINNAFPQKELSSMCILCRKITVGHQFLKHSHLPVWYKQPCLSSQFWCSVSSWPCLHAKMGCCNVIGSLYVNKQLYPMKLPVSERRIHRLWSGLKCSVIFTAHALFLTVTSKYSINSSCHPWPVMSADRANLSHIN